MTTWLTQRLRLILVIFAIVLSNLCTVMILSASAATELNDAATIEDILTLEASPPFSEKAYGTDLLQTVLFFKSATSPKQHVALIHGGCWSNHYSRAHIKPLASALASKGFDVWVPEYRRVGDAGGGWPGTYHDVALALNYIAHQIGKPPIVVGHSAGGHLALLAAADPDVALERVIGLAAITDMSIYGQEEGSCPAMARELIGATYADSPERYRDASVIASDIVIPAHLIIGSSDRIVGENQLEGFTHEQIVQISGAGHFDLIHPKHRAFETLVDLLMEASQ